MQNVLTFPLLPSENNAAFVDESIPPDKNTPTGTSASFLNLTAFLSSEMIASEIVVSSARYNSG